MAKAKSDSASSPKKPAKSPRAKSTRAKRAKSEKTSKPSKGKKSPSTKSTKRPKKDAEPESNGHDEASFAEQLAQARGSTAKAIITARIAVNAIASEKTTETRAAQKEAEVNDENPGQVDRDFINANRRCAKDLFAEFRSQYSKHKPDDPYTEWRQTHERTRHELSQGASLDDLQTAERRLKQSFSPSYWDFCLEWGSGLLFTSPWRETHFIGAKDVLTETKTRLKEIFDPRYLPIARLGPNDYLALDTGAENEDGEYALVWWSDDPEDVPVKVADSFAQWLEQAEACFGDHYWLAE